jgi:hypothetical protein
VADSDLSLEETALLVDEPALDRDESLAEDEASEIAWTKVSCGHRALVYLLAIVAHYLRGHWRTGTTRGRSERR